MIVLSLSIKPGTFYANDGRFIYFFSDPPHLIKTVRNCWASPQRSLWVRDFKCIVIISLVDEWQRNILEASIEFILH